MTAVFKPLRTAKTSLPLQAQLYLENLIKDGTYQPGEQLPSQDVLAEKLGISRATLREALQKLETEGVIQRRHGVGTFVTPNSRQRLDTGLEMLESLEHLAHKSGRQVNMSTLHVDAHFARPSEQKRFGLTGQDEILTVSRVMVLEDRPVAHLVDILPAMYLRRSDLQKDFGGSVLDVLVRLGRPLLSYSYTQIESVAADKDLANALMLHRGEPLLKLEAHLYDQEGQVVDFSVSHFVPGQFNFHVVRRIGV